MLKSSRCPIATPREWLYSIVPTGRHAYSSRVNINVTMGRFRGSRNIFLIQRLLAHLTNQTVNEFKAAVGQFFTDNLDLIAVAFDHQRLDYITRDALNWIFAEAFLIHHLGLPPLDFEPLEDIRERLESFTEYQLSLQDYFIAYYANVPENIQVDAGLYEGDADNVTDPEDLQPDLEYQHAMRLQSMRIAPDYFSDTDDDDFPQPDNQGQIEQMRWRSNAIRQTQGASSPEPSP
jgi:hypothetical protein